MKRNIIVTLTLAMSLWLVLPAAAAGDFTGTWETVSSTGNRFTMQLKQSGNTVRGAYSPENGTIDRIRKGNVHPSRTGFSSRPQRFGDLVIAKR